MHTTNITFTDFESLAREVQSELDIYVLWDDIKAQAESDIRDFVQDVLNEQDPYGDGSRLDDLEAQIGQVEGVTSDLDDRIDHIERYGTGDTTEIMDRLSSVERRLTELGDWLMSAPKYL